DFCIAPQDGLAIGPGKRRRSLAGVSDYWANRRLIPQVRPLKVEGVCALDRNARHKVGSRAAEGALRTVVAIHVEEGNFFVSQDHGLVTYCYPPLPEEAKSRIILSISV